MTLEVEVRSSGPGPRSWWHGPIGVARRGIWLVASTWPRDGVAVIIRSAP
jgi:hypothetical protein